MVTVLGMATVLPVVLLPENPVCVATGRSVAWVGEPLTTLLGVLPVAGKPPEPQAANRESKPDATNAKNKCDDLFLFITLLVPFTQERYTE